MARIMQTDLDVLVLLAELRLATADQLAVATGANAEAMGRRLRQLSSESSYVRILTQDLGTGPGRPRNLFALGKVGAQALVEADRLPPERVDAVVAPSAPVTHRHLLMGNSVWVQLRSIQRRVPFLEATYLATHSPLIERSEGGASVLHDHVAMGDGCVIGFEPDGVFYLRHLEMDKTLLFFLEADRGTEPRATLSERAAIVQKLKLYQQYLASEGYRRYEKRWGSALKGFRLLILAETAQRTRAICRSVQECPPSSFVWVAEHNSLLTLGLHAPIWNVGGNVELAAQSILGSQYERVCNVLGNGGPNAH